MGNYLLSAVALSAFLLPTCRVAAQANGQRDILTATLLTTSGGPQGFRGAAVASIPGGGALVFGGVGTFGPQTNTYLLQGGNWSVQYPLFAPVPRSSAGLAFDDMRGEGVLFGGLNPVGLALSDTWVWGNGQWLLASSGAGPAPRAGHCMAFDRSAGRVLLFGGVGANGVALGDFWVWSGSAWSQLSPGVAPSARAYSSMTWDGARGCLVLFGGRDGTGDLGDIWDWDGSAWQQSMGGVGAPAPRSGHSMAYDPRSERVVVFGGETSGACLDDCWSWDGVRWTEHVASLGSPSSRSLHAMWFDDSAGELRLLAGGCGAASDAELWGLTIPVPPRWGSYGQGCAGVAGVPNLAVRSGSEPRIGSSLVCNLTNVPTTIFNIAFGVVDFQRDSFGGLPIPVGLGMVGLPGCQSWTGAAWSAPLPPMTLNVGTSLTVGLPNWPTLLGSSLYLQALVYDNSNGRWASVSNGVEARIGSPRLLPPNAAFSASPTSGLAPLNVQFQDGSSNLPYAWEWDFDGDGLVDSTLQNPVHSYVFAGSYSVRLTVTNVTGSASSTINGMINVSTINPNPALNMVRINPGSFVMGSVAGNGNEMPTHQVAISYPFWIGKYEVSQGEFASALGFNPSFHRFLPNWQALPVENLDWSVAASYCQAVNVVELAAGRVPPGYYYRLPTEAEWEYCCRAGTSTEWSTGGGLLASQAHFGRSGPSPVGAYPPNPWGLHDMHGNVWEWCLDKYQSYSAVSVINPYNSVGSDVVIRGGSWSDNDYLCRSAVRGRVAPTSTGIGWGLRLVLGPTP